MRQLRFDGSLSKRLTFDIGRRTNGWWNGRKTDLPSAISLVSRMCGRFLLPGASQRGSIWTALNFIARATLPGRPRETR